MFVNKHIWQHIINNTCIIINIINQNKHNIFLAIIQNEFSLKTQLIVL